MGSDFQNLGGGTNDVVGQETVIGTYTDANGNTYTKYRYIKDCGNFPNATNKTVSLNIDFVDILSVTGHSYNANAAFNVPRAFSSQYTADVYYDKQNKMIYITSSYNLSSYKLYVYIDYYR